MRWAGLLLVVALPAASCSAAGASSGTIATDRDAFTKLVATYPEVGAIPDLDLAYILAGSFGPDASKCHRGLLTSDPQDLSHCHPVGQPRLAATTRCDRADPGHARIDVTGPPPAHRVRSGLATASDLLVRHTIGSEQQAARLDDPTLRLHRRTRPPFEHDSILIGHDQSSSNDHRHAATLCQISDGAPGLASRSARPRLRRKQRAARPSPASIAHTIGSASRWGQPSLEDV